LDFKGNSLLYRKVSHSRLTIFVLNKNAKLRYGIEVCVHFKDFERVMEKREKTVSG